MWPADDTIFVMYSHRPDAGVSGLLFHRGFSPSFGGLRVSIHPTCPDMVPVRPGSGGKKLFYFVSFRSALSIAPVVESGNGRTPGDGDDFGPSDGDSWMKKGRKMGEMGR